MRQNIVGALLLITVFAAAWAGTVEFPEDVTVYPKLICIAGIALGVLLILKSWWVLKHNDPSSGEIVFKKYAWIVVILTLSGTLLYIFSLEYLGYMISTASFLIIFSYLFDASSKKYLYPLVGILVTVAIYLLFSTALHIPLPRGILVSGGCF